MVARLLIMGPPCFGGQPSVLTVEAIIGAAYGGDRVAAADDELVVLALVVHALWLSQHHPLEVQPARREI